MCMWEYEEFAPCDEASSFSRNVLHWHANDWYDYFLMPILSWQEDYACIRYIITLYFDATSHLVGRAMHVMYVMHMKVQRMIGHVLKLVSLFAGESFQVPMLIRFELMEIGLRAFSGCPYDLGFWLLRGFWLLNTRYFSDTMLRVVLWILMLTFTRDLLMFACI